MATVIIQLVSEYPLPAAAIVTALSITVMVTALVLALRVKEARVGRLDLWFGGRRRRRE